jgi:hypothetical protein
MKTSGQEHLQVRQIDGRVGFLGVVVGEESSIGEGPSFAFESVAGGR